MRPALTISLADLAEDVRARVWRRIRHPGWVRIEIALLIGALFLSG